MPFLIDAYRFAASGPIVIDSIDVDAAPENSTYLCGGTPVGFIFWLGSQTLPVNVNYSGAGDIQSAVSLSADIVSLTPTGGSDPVTGPGTISAVTFVSDGPFAGPGYSRRAVYHVTYTAPVKAGAGTQTATARLQILDSAAPVDERDCCDVIGSFSCA